MAGIVQMLIGGVTTIPDEYFEYTTLLLPGNGTNGAQNNTFLDSSTNNFTITRNGNTTQGTFSPFSQTGWSNSFDGTDDYLTTPNNAAVNFSNSNFTIEGWYYANTTAQMGYVERRSQTFVAGDWVVFVLNGAILFYARDFDQNNPILASNARAINEWVHFAIVRNGSAFTLYINGTSAATYTSSTSFSDNGLGLTIGRDNGTGSSAGRFFFNGYISNLRIVKGTAVYTSNFTVPTSPLTAITNTSLLTCQSNRFIDNSTNNFTVTPFNGVSVQAFSPFNPTAAWSAATNGGSGYFDGSGDMLQTPSITIGTSNFCFECWLYPTATQGSNTGIFVANTNNGLQCSYYDATSPGGLGIAQKGVAWQIFNNNGIKPIINQWNHVAFVRSGTGTNQTSIFLNGTRIVNGTVSYNYAASQYQLSTTNAAGTVFQGYIANARLTIASTPYDATQSTITIPTAPLTAITNTSLLLNFTNAGIYDATAKNDLETVGNAQISTTQSKFGGSSMAFDGTGDWLIFPNNAIYDFGTGDFTVEFWAYWNSFGSDKKYVFKGTSDTNYWQFTHDSSLGVQFNYNTGPGQVVVANQGSNGGWSTGTWYHVALVRFGNSITIYRNGTSVATGTLSGALTNPASGISIGGTSVNSAASMNGYIQDLRVTKGYARYTAAFTPPSAPFQLL
jgi:hypothetical protein